MAKNGQRITTEIAQQQRLAPLMVQFGRVLEMSAPEIEDHINRALEEMPALELVPNDSHTPEATPTEDGSQFSETEADVRLADFRSADDVPDSYTPSLPSASSRHSFDDYFEPVIAAEGESMIESLESQIGEIALHDIDRQIAHYIIGNLDANGYLTRPLPAIVTDMAINDGIDVSEDQVKKVWNLVRSLEPAGIAATDLRDCLLLQLQRMPGNADVENARKIISKHFDLFSNKNFSRLTEKTALSPEDMRRSLEVISRLNPKPGASIGGNSYTDKRQIIIPDFSVEADQNGRIHVRLLNSIPELQVDATFEEMADKPDPTTADTDHRNKHSDERSRAARAFIRRSRDDARSFIRMLQMRNSTLMQVITAIAKIQAEFFRTGDEETIRPMVLRDIGAITGLDLSNISRATQGKYVTTPHGTYPLKKFFNEKPRQSAANDDSVTANRIIAAIRQTIAAEDPHAPLSDREITQRLTDAGYNIARRTVAKYRESLGYPTAKLRRKI